MILEQNAAVDRLRTESQRPFITITYLGTLTSTSNSAETLTAVREELAGLAVAQRRQIQTDAAFEPLVKVLIANGGERMLHGERVAATLGKLAESDRSVVGVVGLNESREPTLRTIRALAQKGLPVVAAPLSADALADSNSLFYQIAPQNRRQAEVAAAYAANRRDNGASLTGAQIESAARIYVSDDATDIYSQNLASDLQISLVAKGFTTELVNFTPSGAPQGNPNGSRSVDNANVAGRDSCGYGGVVFYVGRPVPDFQSYLEGVAGSCPARPPLIVGGDDVSRYAADVERLKRNSIPFSYITFAVIPEGRDAPQGMPDSLKNFFTTYTGLFPFAGRPEGRSQDGHAALTYDAALSMITAIKYLREGGEQIPITPAATWHQIGQITAPAQMEGATGTIDFGGDVRGRVPVDKAVYLLQVRDGVVNEAVLGFCGRRNGLVQDVWCPRLREMDQP